MILSKILSARIRYFLKQQNMSILTLSKLSTLKLHTIKYLLYNNYKNINIKYICLIASAFNVTLIEFLNTEEFDKIFNKMAKNI